MTRQFSISACMLLLSMLFFAACRQRNETASPGAPLLASLGHHGVDTIEVWLSEPMGTPDEAYDYEIVDLWNATHADVKIKLTMLATAGFQSKLRIAMATNRPPDVCPNAIETLESLQYAGKAENLVVPIPEKYLPASELKALDSVVSKAIMRNGKPVVFPTQRYCYGALLFGERNLINSGGVNDDQLRETGWNIDQFLETCRKITRDTNGDGKTDIYAFGAALVHLPTLFDRTFGPGVFPREIADEGMFKYNPATKKYEVHPSLTVDQIEIIFKMWHQMVNVDKTWNPATLSMNWDEIRNLIILDRTMAMTFGESPQAPKLLLDNWRNDERKGVKHKIKTEPDLTTFWSPTVRPGEKPPPLGGAGGFAVMRQIPDKGATHTDNALKVALFLTHPVNQARGQLRYYHHLPAEPERFRKIYPELLDSNNKFVQFYEQIMDSGLPRVGLMLDEAPDPQMYVAMRDGYTKWVQKDGRNIMEQVIYKTLTPRQGAEKFFAGLKDMVDQAYLDAAH